jgi:hypothetical protein
MKKIIRKALFEVNISIEQLSGQFYFSFYFNWGFFFSAGYLFYKRIFRKLSNEGTKNYILVLQP